MERLAPKRPSGISKNGLRTWGMLFMAAEVISCAVLQNQILGLGTISNSELLQAMQSSETVMNIATIAIVLKALGACAVPIFAFMLTEGAKHTSNFRAYLTRILGLAVVSEIPYNLAYSGKFLDLSTRNPVFSLVFALLVLYFFQRYDRKKAGDILIRIVVTLAAMGWCVMLGIGQGSAVVLVSVVLWLLWDKPLLRNIAGATVLMLCSMFSIFLMAAPMSFLAIHFYNGERGEENRVITYGAYPVLFLQVALAGMILI